MENSSGKWVSIDQYSLRRGVSKGTVYRRIRKGELTKRITDDGTEIFLKGDELEEFENAPEVSEPTAASAPLDMDAEDAYSIAEQSLRAIISMHKEILAEKSRMLREWEEELKRREERVKELRIDLAGKEAMLGERTSEVRDLKRTMRHRDEVIKEHERAIYEYRRLQEQREEIEHFADSSREELTEALSEKDRLLEEKDKIIDGIRNTIAQREDVHKEGDRLIGELKKSLDETRALITEKDAMIERLKTGDTSVLEDEIKTRDQTITELRELVNTLQSQLDMQAHSTDLTGFSEESAPETGTLIQDQLEYLMHAEDPSKYHDETIPPEGDDDES